MKLSTRVLASGTKNSRPNRRNRKSPGSLPSPSFSSQGRNPLVQVGAKDITAHVDFTGVALAGQEAGLAVLGYCNQARFLINCGLVARLEHASVQQRAMAARLIHEHEMGELFKVIGFVAGVQPWDSVGFREGDRTHTL